MAMAIKISRYRVMRSRFATGPGPAWKWLYTVTAGESEVAHGVDLLSIARRFAQRASRESGEPIVETWRMSEASNG